MAAESPVLVSVLVPVYNQEKFITDCLDSVLAQDYPNIELVVLDDGSTDRSVAIATKWIDQNGNRLASAQIHQQENRGVSRAFNRLVALSKGDFVAPLAADDYLLQGGIRRRVEALEQHDAWLAVFGDCKVVDEESQVLSESGIAGLIGPSRGSRKRALLHPKLIGLELILRWSIPGPALLMRRDAYREDVGVGPYKEHLKAEDRDFHLRLVARAALGFVDVPVAAYRVHGESASQTNPSLMRDTILQSDRENLHLFNGLQKLGLLATVRHREARERYRSSSGLARIYHRWGVRLFRMVRSTVMRIHDARIARVYASSIQ